MRNFKISDDIKDSKINSQNTQYEKYKKALHAFFDGNAPLPSHLIQSSTSDEVASQSQINSKNDTSKIRKERVVANAKKITLSSTQSIRSAITKNEISIAVAQMISLGHELPNEEDILSKVLTCDDVDIKHQALQKLEALAAKTAIKNPKLVRSRLENTALLAKSREIHDYCLSIRDMIA